MAVIILFTCGYAALAWKRPEWALTVLLFLLPTYQIRFQLGPLPMTLLEMMVVVLFVVWLVQAVSNNELPLLNRKLKGVRPYPFGYELIALLVIAFVAMGVAGFSMSALGIFKAYFLEAAMFFIVFVNILSAQGGPVSGWKNPAHRPKIFWALAASAFVVSLVAIYQALTGSFLPSDWVGTGRVTGVFAYPNAVGLYLGPIAVLVMGWVLSRARNNKPQITSSKKNSNINPPNGGQISNFLFFPARLATRSVACPQLLQRCRRAGRCFFVFLPLVAIVMAKSEGALAGVAAALLVMGLLYNKWSRRTVVVLLLAGALIIGLNGTLRHDVTKKITLMDTDGQIRRQQWSETWQMLTSSPQMFIFGAGLANYQTAVAPYHQSGIYVRNDDEEFDRWVQISLEYQQQVWQPLEIYLYPHNLLLNFWVELGLAGALLFVWIIGKYLVLSIWYLVSDIKVKGKRYEKQGLVFGLLGAMIVIVVHGMVDVPYFKNDLALLFWLLVGMVGVMNVELAANKTN